MNPRRAQLASMLTLLAVVVAARHAAGQAIPSAETRARTTSQTETQTARVSHRPAGRPGVPAASAAASGRDALPSDVSAPRLTSRRASLRLCDGGDPVPTTVFSEETLCLEQPLPGVTRGEARRRALHAASVDVTFAGDRVAPEHVGDPELVTPSDDDDDTAGGGDELLHIDDEETFEEETSDDDAVEDVFVRFTLSVAGLPAGAKDALEAAVTVVPVGRFSYDIVWYELSVIYPTFYSYQVDVVVQEGHDAGKPEEEIEQDVEDLKEGSATFFPCTNFIAGPFCDEAGISA